MLSASTLVKDAGLIGELATSLETEGLDVRLLMRSSLGERREVLRAMGCSFGQILAINRVLEGYRERLEDGGLVDDENDGNDSNDDDDDDDKDDKDDKDAHEDEDDNDDEEDARAAAGEEEEPEAATPAKERPAVVIGPWPAELKVSASLAAQLQAAAMLLGRAEPHTLKALQAYLGNVCAHPTQSTYRTIELTSPLFNERVWGVPGGASIMRAAGFAESPLAPGQPGRKGIRVLTLATRAPIEPLKAALHVVEALLAAASPSAAPTSPAPTAYVGSPEKRASAAAAAAAAAAAVGPGGGVAGGVSTPAATSSNGTGGQWLREAAEAVRTVDGLIESAHTLSWDAAISSSSTVRLESTSAHEIASDCVRLRPSASDCV